MSIEAEFLDIPWFLRRDPEEARKEQVDFGDYCEIEQKRYGAPNEMYLYKVIGRLRCNYYRSVPVDANDQDKKHGDITEAIRAIRCGIDETKVETFRLQDVQPCSYRKTGTSQIRDLK